MKNIAKIIEENHEKVIIEIKDLDLLEIAKYSYLGSNVKYITIIKDEDNIIFTLIYKNGNIFSWTKRTLVADEIKVLQKKIIEFLNDNCIMINYVDTSKIIKFSYYYNNNFNDYQINIVLKNGKRIARVLKGNSEAEILAIMSKKYKYKFEKYEDNRFVKTITHYTIER